MLNKLPLPVKFKTSFKYNQDSEALTTLVAGVLNSRTWRVNSLFDPDFSLGGEQPMGYDQMMAFYNKYTVIGFRAQMVFYNTANHHMQVAIYFSVESSVPVDWERIIENGAKQIVLPPFGASGTPYKVSVKVAPHKLLSVTKPLSEPDLAGSDGSNPAREVYCHVVYKNPTAAEGPGVIRCNTTITYAAVLHDAQMINRS